MSYCFKITILAQMCIKMRYFYSKIAKFAQRWGLGPHTPLPPAAGGFTPRPRQHPMRNLGYATGTVYLSFWH